MKAHPGQPWGTRSLRLKLPGVRVKLSGLSAAQLTSLEGHYPGFIGDAAQGWGKYDVECRAYRLKHPPAVSSSTLTLDGQYAPRQVRQLGGIDLTGINFEAYIGLKSSPVSASLGVAAEHELTQANVIENFLRVYAAHRVLELGGVVLHSAGLVFDGRAYLFVGRSNAGKTTLTRKAHKRGARVLSDDINLLLPNQGEGGYAAFAVPFTGEFGRTLDHQGGRESYPVVGVALLEQGDRLKTEAVRSSEAVARLLVGCPFVNTDAEESAALFDALTGLVAQVPAIRLACRCDDGVDEIMQAVKNGFANG